MVSFYIQGLDTKWAPAAFFGAFSLVSGLLSILLPETKSTSLDDDTQKDKGEASELKVSHSAYGAGNTNYSFTDDHGTTTRF